MIRWLNVVGAATLLFATLIVAAPAAQAVPACPITDPTCVLGSVGQAAGSVGQGVVGGVGQTVGQVAGGVGQTVSHTTTTVTKAIQSTTKTVGQLTGQKTPTGDGPGQGSGPAGGGQSGPGGTGIGTGAGGSAPGGASTRSSGGSAVHAHHSGALGQSTPPIGVSIESSIRPASQLQRSSDRGSFISRVLPEAASLALLFILIAMAIAFLGVQDRLDRRDPRLAAAFLGSDRVSFR